MNCMDNEASESTKQNRFNLKLLLIIAAVVVVIAIVGFILLRKDRTAHNPDLPTEVTVELTDEGFNPNEVTIQTGAAVRWVNKSTDEEVSVNSDDHPDHRKHPELNLGVIPAESSVVHIFNSQGEFTYHDHFHPERTGKVIVK